MVVRSSESTDLKVHTICTIIAIFNTNIEPHLLHRNHFLATWIWDMVASLTCSYLQRQKQLDTAGKYIRVKGKTWGMTYSFVVSEFEKYYKHWKLLQNIYLTDKNDCEYATIKTKAVTTSFCENTFSMKLGNRTKYKHWYKYQQLGSKSMLSINVSIISVALVNQSLRDTNSWNVKI